MPIKFHFRPDNNLIISVHKGIVKDDEFINSYRSLCENYLFKTGMNLLVDLRKADSSYRSSEGLYSIAGFLESRYQDFNKEPKIAVLAPKNISFGLARVFHALSGNIPIEYSIFRSSEEALSWLDAPNSLLEIQ